ncbi:MAG: PPC domain-containing protein [Acidobacteria bacterium]|nr:PPC domain-containing protein [Acidobacteriota bacterium]
MRFFRLLAVAAAVSPLTAADLPSPKIVRVYPLGGQRGASLALEILGEYLANAISVEFDCRDLVWTRTSHASSGKLAGTVSISPQAALGPHMLRAVTLDGYSTSALFNVGQFPSVPEAEPNDSVRQAQEIPALPVEIQGGMDGAPDIDVYAIRVRASERWTFDLRSIEYGSALEAKMFLLDSRGNRVAFDDDRSDFDETPFIEHTFPADGKYYIKLDQYRGPRGFNFGKNSTYILRISALPVMQYASPFGARAGRTTRIALAGTALENLESVHLTEIRRGEYARFTYPFTMPIHFRADSPTAAEATRIVGNIRSRTAQRVDVDFQVPAGSSPGLWRLWGRGSKGVSDGPEIEITDSEEYDERSASQGDSKRGEYTINGSLERPGEQDVYRIEGVAGRPLHFWTLAAQLGIPNLDTVLLLRDAAGKKLAENDDVVAGQGTLIGNPDSSLFYTPSQDGPLFLGVKDRLRRGGPSYQYRLKIKSEASSFQLFTTPENFVVPREGSGEIKVHLIREAGFAGEVSVWFEGMPPGVEAPRGKFRADQLFEPNADGADMIIPAITFQIRAPASLPPGNYPIRISGVATAEEGNPNRRVVEAGTTLIMGPLLDLWTVIRRPLPQITMTVCEPPPARLSSQVRSLTLPRTETATLELKAEGVPERAPFRVLELPPGVTYRRTGRQGDQITLTLEASAEAPLGSRDISAETEVRCRRISTLPIAVSITPAPKKNRPGI